LHFGEHADNADDERFPFYELFVFDEVKYMEGIQQGTTFHG
jgi:hypothetical protein